MDQKIELNNIPEKHPKKYIAYVVIILIVCSFSYIKFLQRAVKDFYLHFISKKWPILEKIRTHFQKIRR